MDDFLKDYSPDEASEDAIFLSALGLLEPDFDLYNFYLDFLTEQIAGFYDPETDEMFVVQGSGFKGREKLTYAHEFVHALQDIYYGTETGLGCDDDAWEVDSERCAAYKAMVEGDASFVEILWFSENGTNEDLSDIQEFLNSYESPVFDAAPAFMGEDFLFPYTYGQPFVEYLHNQDDWQSVEDAFDNPPVSTEQILHPEKYPSTNPDWISLTQSLGWMARDRSGVMGSGRHVSSGWLDPQAQIDPAEAQDASAGWGGDAYVVYYNEQEHTTVLVLSSTWDTQQEAVEFSESFAEYANGRFGPATEEGSGLTSWESPSDFTTFSHEGEPSGSLPSAEVSCKCINQ
jgi:hypothetical protein